MSFNPHSGIRQFHDNEACGSDCAGGKSPCGLTCTGSGGAATHACSGNNAATQNEVQTLLALFGPTPVAPTIAITNPGEGATVAAGYPIQTTCTSASGVESVAVAVDASKPVLLTSPPYDTTVPAAIAPGAHTITATCTSVAGKTAAASVHVMVAGLNGGPDGGGGPSDGGTAGDADAGGAGAAPAGGGASDGGGCELVRSSRPAFSLEALGLLLATLGLRRAVRARRR